jgi:hypothetical protein
MAFSEKDIRAMGTTLTKVKKGSEASNWLIGSLTSIGEIGAEVDEIDITTLDSPDGAKEYMAGDRDFGECPIAGHIKKDGDRQTITKMLALINNNSLETWKVTYPSGDIWEFTAFVKSFKTTEASVDGLLGFSATLRISGAPTYTVAP